MAFKVATHYLQVAGFGYLVANLASLGGSLRGGKQTGSAELAKSRRPAFCFLQTRTYPSHIYDRRGKVSDSTCTV